MAAFRPTSTPRRPRRGSLERPVSGRTYRGTALLGARPLVIAAFPVARAGKLPAPTLPPSFDQLAAVETARELAIQFPNRAPGSEKADDATDWAAQRFRSYGFRVQRDRFDAAIAGLGRVPLEDVYAVGPHRDNAGIGPGANDNASGTGALIELARGYGVRASPTAGRATAALSPAHTLVFLSSDAGAFGGLGVRRFLERSPYRTRLEAAVNLDAIGGQQAIRLDIAA